MKKIIYCLISFIFLGLNYVNADFFPDKVSDDIRPNKNPLDVESQRLIGNFIWFLYIVAVVYGLWGGFNILTAWWAEEKVKKWRAIIIHSLIGLVVIFLANSIVWFVVTNILWNWVS